MSFSRFSLAGACVAMFDYALIAALAIIGSLWWLAAWLGFSPSETRIVDGFLGLAAVWTLLALFLYWRGAGRIAWLAVRRRRVVSTLALLVAAGLGLLRLRALTWEADNSGETLSGVYLLLIQAGVFLSCLIGLFLLRHEARRRGWLAMTRRTVLAAGVAGYLIYLGWDEPVSPSVARNHTALAGRFEDEATYLLTLRYSPAPGGGRVLTPPTRRLELQRKGEKYRDYLLAHRAEIEANWAELADVREWWTEMAAQPQLGDRPVKGFEQPVMRFQPMRHYMQYAAAMAGLQALDGDGDGALETLIAVHDVGARLEPASATLLRGMIARQTIRQALEAAEFVLDHAHVSSEMRARFASRLAESQSGGHTVKRLILAECGLWTRESISRFVRPQRVSGDQWRVFLTQGVSAILAPITLNPQATANLVHEYCERIALCAEARDMDGIRVVEDGLNAELLEGFQIKNLSGRLFMQMSVPAFSPFVKGYWDIEDRRGELIRRLRETPVTR